MSFNLRNRSPLDPIDFAPRDIRYLLDLAAGLKRTKAAAREPPAHDQGGIAGYARSLGD